VANLDAGADDYVTKPFSLAELLARVRARLRAADQTVSTRITHGRVTVDVLAREALIEGRSVELTSREFALLETMIHHPGQVLSQPQLMIKSGATTTTRGPTWSRCTSATCARNCVQMSSRPSGALGIGSAADLFHRIKPSNQIPTGCSTVALERRRRTRRPEVGSHETERHPGPMHRQEVDTSAQS
jgi:hypothetical protein